MDKLFQMLSNSMEKQQQQQQQQDSQTTTNMSGSGSQISTAPTPTDNGDDVMRFFRNITPPPSLNNSAANLNTQTNNNNNNNNNNVNTKQPSISSFFHIKPVNEGAKQYSNITHQGMRINGRNISIDSGKLSKVNREIESQTLTIISTKKDNFLGNYITTNTNYICYIIKGKVRILDGSSSNKALIKNDFKEAIDVQFHSESIDIISVCTESDIFIYSISKVSGDTQQIQTLLTCQIPYPSNSVSSGSSKSAHFSFVVWHPTQMGVLAACPMVSVDSQPVYLFNIYAGKDPILKIQAPPKETIYGVCFNADGTKLAICTNEGTVNVYDTSDISSGALEAQLIYSRKYPGSQKRFRFIQFVQENVLLLSTQQTEVLLVRLGLGGNFELVQSITFRPPLHQDYNLVTYRDQYLLIADSNDHKCYCLHLDIPSNHESEPHFDFVTHFDLKSPIFSFTLKSFPYDQVPQNPMMGGQSMVAQREQKNFYIYSFQSVGVYRYRIVLADRYLPSDEYSLSDHQYIQQLDQLDNGEDASGNNIEVSIFKFLDSKFKFGQQGSEETTEGDIDATVNSSTANPSGNQDEDLDMILLTPKSFSSPPPVSLPDPDLQDDSTRNASTTTTTSTTTPKDKKKKKKVNKTKDQLSVNDASLPSPTLSSSSSSTSPLQSPHLTASEKTSTQKDMLSNAVAGGSGVTIVKSKSNQSLGIVGATQQANTSPNQKTTATTSTGKISSPPIPTTTNSNSNTSPLPTQKLKEKVNVTPSFIPPPLNIPVLNPPHKGSAANTSSNSLTPQKALPVPNASLVSPPPQPQQPQVQNTSTTTATTSSMNGSNGDISHLLKEMENSLFNRLEKSMINQFNVIEKERLERENLEREKQEKLLIVVHQTIQSTVKSNLEKIVKKELTTLTQGMEKQIQQSLETTMTKLTVDYMKKITTKATENLTTQLKGTLTSETFETMVQQQIESVFLNYFKSILIPGFEKSCKEMFKNLSFVYSKGFQESIQHQTLTGQAQHLSIQKSIQDEFKLLKDQNDLVMQQLLKDRESLLSDMKSIVQQQQQQQQIPPPPIPQFNNPMMGYHQSSPMGRGSTGMPDMMQYSQYNMSQPPPPPMPQMSSMPNLPINQMQPIPSPQIQSPHTSTPSTVTAQNSLTSANALKLFSQFPALKAFIDKGDYVNALNYSLNASNLSMVVGLCSLLDPVTVLSKQPQLPQNTILSLIQQLTIDLANPNDPETKLRWIKEGLSVFDITNCARPDVAKKIFTSLRNRIDQQLHLQAVYPYYVNSIKNLIKE
ncbi:hypothetical protein DLAC_08880 [Tieghemostelium lacteum]|uniref:Enhancer of mRNA-decapping protein 4 C-terminal domain-containing protein n=1 Tax=Tieghemostelium lacteum TaxID=361077 RepID=A0A151Z8L3_TIELA|nr:hypothetical protein DLAC_08880 [Tieghemostelium lacteum]|eukprot:KYQ90278.1 hypothetical protein DLAC_08880 [Tieghemostelium lacteum]